MESKKVFTPKDRENKPSKISRYIRVTIAIVAILGLLQFSGLYQYSFFRKTPQELAQTPLKSAANQEAVTIPLSIYVVKSQTPLNSFRDQANVKDIVADSAKIWQQANINLEIKSIEEIDLGITDTLALLAYPRQLIKGRQSEKDNSVKVFFTRTLNGLNGISYGRSNTLTVADYTSNTDFRVLAHEIGHILGLPHVKDTNALMFKGANSTNLSQEEINIARNFAEEL